MEGARRGERGGGGLDDATFGVTCGNRGKMKGGGRQAKTEENERKGEISEESEGRKAVERGSEEEKEWRN